MTPLAPGERRWAATAHLSLLLTASLGWAAGGWGATLALLAPLALGLYFRARAPRVAFHALQAAVFQAGGACLYVVAALLTVAGLGAFWLVSLVLSLTPAGVLPWPAAIGLSVAAAASLAGAPLAGLGWALHGAWRAYHGQPFAYPLAGVWAARALGLEAPA